MKPVAVLTDASLRFHVADAFEAVQANPRNPKAAQYLAEAHECERELLRRAMIRARREQMRLWLDPLQFPLRQRGRLHVPTWKRREALEAAHSLAFLTHCKPGR